MSPQQVGKLLTQLEDRMYEAARNLEFEEAARIRDRVSQLSASLIS